MTVETQFRVYSVTIYNSALKGTNKPNERAKQVSSQEQYVGNMVASPSRVEHKEIINDSCSINNNDLKENYKIEFPSL